MTGKFTSDETLDQWFGFHPPVGEGVAAAHERVRAACRELAQVFSDLTVALRAVREAMYHANACIAVAQKLYEPEG